MASKMPPKKLNPTLTLDKFIKSIDTKLEDLTELFSLLKVNFRAEDGKEIEAALEDLGTASKRLEDKWMAVSEWEILHKVENLALYTHLETQVGQALRRAEIGKRDVSIIMRDLKAKCPASKPKLTEKPKIRDHFKPKELLTT